jgi:hypothetical protein
MTESVIAIGAGLIVLIGPPGTARAASRAAAWQLRHRKVFERARG